MSDDQITQIAQLTAERDAAEKLLLESRDPVYGEYYESGNHEIDPDDMWAWRQKYDARQKRENDNA